MNFILRFLITFCIIYTVNWHFFFSEEKPNEQVVEYETCAGITHDVTKVTCKIKYTGTFNDEFPYEETKCAQLVMNASFMKAVMNYTFKELVEGEHLKDVITNTITNEVLTEFNKSEFKIHDCEFVYHNKETIG